MQNLCAWSAELPFWSRDVLLGRVCKPADGIYSASRMPFDLLVARGVFDSTVCWKLEQLGLYVRGRLEDATLFLAWTRRHTTAFFEMPPLDVAETLYTLDLATGEAQRR